jgi:hypothetical protein
MKKQVKKLVLAKETVRMLDLVRIEGGVGISAYQASCPDASCFPYYCQREPFTRDETC